MTIEEAIEEAIVKWMAEAKINAGTVSELAKQRSFRVATRGSDRYTLILSFLNDLAEIRKALPETPPGAVNQTP